ncbi:MAG: cytochrome ubiquinol oxidase subunit I [Planctomycetes bacterium]|nr:cytochrome ubiquinol oxidase subunit I [Planctomycetota bacterium]
MEPTSALFLTLASASASAGNLLAARLQMGLTLGFHIVFACLGVGLPALLVLAEGSALRRGGDPLWHALARRWSKAFAVLFAVGAVSGTVLSFELGLLWPRFMGAFGAVVALPFTLEGFAFFIEAIFAGIYLYTWDRLPARAHWWTGLPIAVGGAASAAFVVTVNAWMNTPGGYRMDAGGRVIDVAPGAAMWTPAAAPQVAHMLLAAYIVTGFLVAGFYAWRRLCGEDTPYVRRGMATGLALGAALAPLQFLVGDWAARTVAATQPAKFAAMEGQYRTEAGAPLRIGGFPDEAARRTRWALEVPGGLSWLAFGDRRALVRGLDEFAPADRPPVALPHLAFQAMVGAGSALAALAAWAGASWALRRRLPESRLFLAAVAAGGPLAVLALEAGWVVTEVGRQPWVVQGVMRTAEAATTAPGVGWVLAATSVIYLILTAGTVAVLGRLARMPVRLADSPPEA